MPKLISFAGLVTFLIITLLISEARRKINWRLVAWGLGLQFVFALLILKTTPGAWIFTLAQIVMTGIIDFTEVGASFLFGNLVSDTNIGAIVAFKMLPIVIFTSSLMAILYYFRLIQFFVKGMAHLMHITMRASGVEATGAGLFVFMGIEAVTAIRTYLGRTTRSELFCIMTAFMSTIAGSVMAIYTGFGAEAGHLLAASVMSAPAAIAIAKIMIPEVEEPETAVDAKLSMELSYDNPLEAAADGATEGLKLALSIGAMLIAFISLIALFNWPLQYLHTSFEQLLGYICTPFAFLMGVPLGETVQVGQLIGIKTILNEFLAFIKMQEMIGAGLLSPRSIVISTYLLCGFANFGSLAILIGGIGSLVPARKKEVVSLGIKSLIAGTLAKFMTATIAGILL